MGNTTEAEASAMLTAKAENALAEAEAAAWQEAYYIAGVGAVNAAAVASRLAKHTAALTHLIGTQGARKHPALRAIAGHLAYLFGYGLGPDDDLCREVMKHKPTD